jgi:hypothetical protein
MYERDLAIRLRCEFIPTNIKPGCYQSRSEHEWKKGPKERRKKKGDERIYKLFCFLLLTKVPAYKFSLHLY